MATVQEQMQANSKAWFSADSTEQARLAAENQKLAAGAGITKNAAGDWNYSAPSTTPTATPQSSGSSILQQVYDSRNSAGSNYTSPAPNYSTPSTPSYTAPATSYTGSSNIIGNTSGAQDPMKATQNIASNYLGNSSNQLNTWSDNSGNVYNTTNMTPQQTYALQLNKSGNKDAAAILKGMGLDINGNPTSPSSVFSANGANNSGLSSDPRQNYPVYASSPNPTQTGTNQTLSDSQKSAQDWINNSTSGQGGLTNYVNTQQGRYQQALASGDQDMINKLQADAQRVGYTLNGSNGSGGQTNTGSNQGSGAQYGFNGNQPSSGWQGSGQSAADLINSIYNANYSSQAQKLKEARDMQLAGLAGQDSVINQSAVEGLNNNDVAAKNRMQQLREAMAAQGLLSSGDNISAQLAIGTDQQQGANDINTNKTNKLSDLMAMRGAINNNASASDMTLMQQLQAARDSQLLTQSNADRTFNYNAGQDTIKNGQWDKSFGLQEGQLTGNYDPNASVKQQMAANSAAWFDASPSEKLRLAAENQKLGASIGAKQDANGDWVMPQSSRTLAGQQMDVAEAQRQWDNAFKGKQFDQQVASDLWERTFKENSFDQSVKQFAANLGQDYAKMSQSSQQFAAEMAYKQKALDMQNDPNSLDNKYKQAQIDKLNNPSSSTGGNFNLDDYKGYINQNYYKTDPMTNTKSFDQGSAERYIVNLNIPSAQKAQLYQMYNIPLK